MKRGLLWGTAGTLVVIGILVFGNLYFAKMERENIELIKNITITMADADGTSLPPKPDAVENDQTVAGIDVNGNYIRDDVELAIFEKYPGEENLKLRAALLQYAQSLQKSLTLVIGKESWREDFHNSSRAYSCLADYIKATDRSDSFVVLLDAVDWLRNLVVSIETRKDHAKDMQWFAHSPGVDRAEVACDLEL